MPAPALRLQEPTFRDGIAKYVARTCRVYGIPDQDVEDLTQETLTNIVKRIDSFRPDDGEFEQWAKGVAVNVIRNYWRELKRYLNRFSGYYPNVDDYAASDPSPERCARRNQARCAIKNAAQGISSRQAQVLVLHAVHDMSHGEIGGELCISESMSQKDYQRALDHLALCIAGKTFAAMPPSLTGCDEPISSNKNQSRRHERAHYAVQFIASILLFLMVVPSCFEPRTLESKNTETRVLGSTQHLVMYSSDELTKVHDEPVVLRDAPRVKLEPASLTSVRDVSTPTKSRDKLTYVQDLAPIPPFKPTESTTAHLPPGR